MNNLSFECLQEGDLIANRYVIRLVVSVNEEVVKVLPD